MSRTHLAVEVRDIGRVYTTRRRITVCALDGVSLSIPPGEVHGLLGPNGAGKTTLFKILSTVLLPTSGQACVCGYDVVTQTRQVRPLLGIVLGSDRGLYTRLSARQNLQYWGALYRLPRADIRRRAAMLLDRVGLSDRADQRVEEFSRGMKQRLHLARGLMSDGRVLLLDEPTTGMDPVAALEFRRLIGELRGEGRTLLIATHDMDEAEAICDRVTLIDHGRILATRPPRELAGVVSRSQRIDVGGAPAALLDGLVTMPGVQSVIRNGDGSARIAVDDDRATGTVLRTVVDAGVTTVRTSAPSLEEVYIRIVGERGLEV